MSEKTLSTHEIDSLLGLFRGRTADAASATSYDLDTPSVAPRGTLEGVIVRHEVAARQIRDEIAAVLNLDVDVALESFEQARFSSLRDQAQPGSSCFLVELGGLRDPAFVVLDAVLAFAAIDRLLGGKGDAPPAAREMTSTELAVLEELLRPVVAAHVAAWSVYAPLRIGAMRPVAVARYIRELKGEEVMFSARYRFAGFADGASLLFATPAGGLEPHLQKEPRPIAAVKDGSGERDLAAHLAMVRVGVRVRVGGAVLSLRELTALEPGDVVVLDRAINDGCELCVQEAPKFTGWLGQNRGRLTYRVKSLLGQKPVQPAQPVKKEPAPAGKTERRS